MLYYIYISYVLCIAMYFMYPIIIHVCRMVFTCYSQLLMPGMHPPNRWIFRGHATICAFRGVKREGVLARCHGHQPLQKGGYCCVSHVLYMYGIYSLKRSILNYICTYTYIPGVAPKDRRVYRGCFK